MLWLFLNRQMCSGIQCIAALLYPIPICFYASPLPWPLIRMLCVGFYIIYSIYFFFNDENKKKYNKSCRVIQLGSRLKMELAGGNQVESKMTKEEEAAEKKIAESKIQRKAAQIMTSVSS